MIARWKLAAAAVAVVGVIAWRRRPARAAGTTSVPGSRVTFSQFVGKDGRCYRVDLFSDGSSSSTLVADGPCFDLINPNADDLFPLEAP